MQNSMEDTWKDINLTETTLQGNPSSMHQRPNIGIFFQDQLSSPSPKHPPPTNAITTVEFSLFHSTPPMRGPTIALNLNNSAPEKSLHQTDDLNHQRHLRRIKNREAAARSRARKQAYTDGLKLTVSDLMKENARLRKELQPSQRWLGPSAELPTKRKLRRTLTAPF